MTSKEARESASAAEPDRTFLARYGAVILGDGIAAIPRAVYRYQARLGLTPAQVWFISAILACKWSSDLPRPSLKQMAEQTGVSVRYLQGIRKELESRGWLLVVERRDVNRAQEANGYDFKVLFGAIEELLQTEGGEPNSNAGGMNNGSPPRMNYPGVNYSSPSPPNNGSSPGMHNSSPLKESNREEASLEEPFTPPTPPRGSNGSKDPGDALAVAVHEILGRQLSASDLERVRRWPGEFSKLAESEMLAVVRDVKARYEARGQAVKTVRAFEGRLQSAVAAKVDRGFAAPRSYPEMASIGDVLRLAGRRLEGG